MFGFFKKKETIPENLPAAPALDIEREMGLTEYVSVDSIKAHLVDMLEENRRLKKENEELKEDRYKRGTEERKRSELLSVTADEWKKRAGESERKIKELQKIIDEQDENIDEMQKEINNLITKAETAKEFAKKTQEEAKEQQQCRYWLREHLERYGNKRGARRMGRQPIMLNTDDMPVFCRNQCANTKCAKHITKAYECGGSCSMQLLRGQPECAGYISRRKRK